MSTAVEKDVWPKYQRPFYFHFRNVGKSKAVTVCMVPIGEGEKRFEMGVARCNEKDNFSKKIGRAIAEGRANKRPKFVDANNFSELLEQANEIANRA